MVCAHLKRYQAVLLGIIGMVLAVIPSGFAQVFSTDFNSGVPAGALIPPGPAADPNEARVDGGYLKLTDAINSSCGFFYVNDFSGGGPVTEFVASFKASLFGSICCGTAGNRPADGFSFNLVPASSLNPTPAYIPSELGLAEGLSVTFDSWDAAAPNNDGPNIKVKWLGTEIGVAPIQPSQSPAGATTAEAAAKLVRISLRSDGKIDVAYGDAVAFAGLQTPYDPAVVGAPAWVLTARTGGANDNHWIDDLSIATLPASQVVIAPQGSVWAFNDETLTGSNLHGTGWQTPAYDTNSAAGWKEGIALFGNDAAGIYNAAGQPFTAGAEGFSTPLNRGASDRATFYFRTKFNWTGSAVGVSLIASNWVDDGMVAYLNGVEVSRIRVPAAPAEITWDTLGENPPVEGAVEVRTWDTSALVEGENVVAVEVHQSSLGSSDVAFALALAARGPLAPIVTDLFQPSNRVVLANRETTLSVVATGSPAPTYQWYKDGNPIPDATGSSYTIPLMSAADAGSYFARVSNAVGSVDSRTAVVEYNFDNSPPAITQAVGSGTFDKVVVSFNELIDEAAAVDSFNFTIADSGGNALNVVSSVLNGNGSSVTLATDPQTPNTVYTVTVTSMPDRAGNVLDSATANFTSWVPTDCGGVEFSLFTQVGGGTDINLLTNHPTFPNSPDEVRHLATFDTGADIMDNYGGRIRGLFIPPVSGSWNLFVTADDGSRVFFNANGPSASGAVLISQETPGCCTAFAGRKTGPFELEAGKGYYLEGIYKEAGGGDYIRIAARLAADSVTPLAPIPPEWAGSPAAPLGVGGPVEISQQPVNQSVFENALVTFSITASNPNGLPICYQWTRDGSDIPGATRPTYTLGPVTLADSGAVFAVKVGVIGTSTVSSSATLTVEQDVTPPTVVSLRGSTDLSRLVLTLSEFITDATAIDTFNYELAGSTITTATLGADGRTITISLQDPLTPETAYQLKVSGLADLSGNEMVEVTVPVTTLAIRPGFALADLYLNIPGVLVTDLTSSPKYPASPDIQRYKGLLELNTFDEFENYGARMSGWLTAPVSGNYNFFMSSDDGGALYLSTDMSPANLVLIASEPVWNGRRDWVGVTRRNAAAPENRSSTLFPGGIPLTAGQQYYFEALVKEGGGGDNLAVAWQLPGAPEPINGSTPIPGIYMSSLVDPTGASLQITQQPVDQTFVIASDTLMNETFDSGDGGFTVITPDGAFNTPWTFVSGSWQVNQNNDEVNHPMTSLLTSPSVTVTKAGAVVLTIDHRYSFEGDQWDGGQIQISVNGGDFVQVPAAAFTQNGYDGTVRSDTRSILAGRPGFLGNSVGHATGLRTTIATLGTFNVGDTVRVRLVYAGDTNTGGPLKPNWELGRIAINQGAQGAQSVTFATAIAATGPNASTVLYQWFRDNGSGFAPIPGANSSSFTLVPVLADNGAKFKVEVYIPGANATSDVATLTVFQPNTPPRFTAAPGDQNVLEDSGPQSVQWATDITAFSAGIAPANFNALPPGSALGGNAALGVGALHLTDAINSQQGSFVTPASPTPIDSLTVTFKALIGGGTCCGDRTADGWSLTIGDVIVPVTFPVAAEEGAAQNSGFAVNFDSWDNAGADEAPAVDVKVGGSVIAFQSFDGVREGGRPPAGPLITDPATGAPMTYKTGTSFTDVRIQLDPDGTLDVYFKGVRVIDNVQTGVPLPLTDVRLAFGARTGGANDNHWIDDLLVVGSLNGEVVVVYPPQENPEPGQTVHFNVSNDNPSLFSVQPAVSSSGVLTYTPAPNANGSALVTVVAQDDGGTLSGGVDSSAPVTFRINVAPVNDCPTASGQAISVDAGATATIQLSGSDVEGNALTYNVAQGPAHGGVIIQSGTGAATYTPTAGYSGPDSFTFTVSDGTCASAPATVSITVRSTGNECPVAVAKVEPNVQLSVGQVGTIVIAGNNTNACLNLDGTGSTDADGDSLTYAWVLVLSDGSTVPLATGATATACLDVGTYTVRLLVDDGTCVRTADVAVEIITASEAVDSLIDKVNDSTIERKNKRPFIASLKAAGASFDRGSCNSASGQLGAFINKVRAQIAKDNPVVAADLIRLANAILASVDCPEEEQQ